MSYQTVNEFLSVVDRSVDPVTEIKKADAFIQNLLYINYADWLWFELPEGEPPFQPHREHSDIAPLKLRSRMASRMLAYFSDKSLSQAQRETMFIKTLQDLPVPEAKLLVAVKDKKLQELFPNITREVVDTAFPTMLVVKQ